MSVWEQLYSAIEELEAEGPEEFDAAYGLDYYGPQRPAEQKNTQPAKPLGATAGGAR